MFIRNDRGVVLEAESSLVRSVLLVDSDVICGHLTNIHPDNSLWVQMRKLRTEETLSKELGGLAGDAEQSYLVGWADERQDVSSD